MSPAIDNDRIQFLECRKKKLTREEGGELISEGNLSSVEKWLLHCPVFGALRVASQYLTTLVLFPHWEKVSIYFLPFILRHEGELWIWDKWIYPFTNIMSKKQNQLTWITFIAKYYRLNRDCNRWRVTIIHSCEFQNIFWKRVHHIYIYI